MPLSKARDAERKKIERKIAKAAHWALGVKQEEDRIRLDKQILSPQISKPVQPDSQYILDAIANLDAVSPPDDWPEDYAPISRISQQIRGIVSETTRDPSIDADGNVMLDYEDS